MPEYKVKTLHGRTKLSRLVCDTDDVAIMEGYSLGQRKSTSVEIWCGERLVARVPIEASKSA